MLRRALLVACALAIPLGAARAQIPDTLVGGRRATWKDATGTAYDSASVSFAKDPALLALTDPRCATTPGGAFLRFSSPGQVNPAVNLPCANWSVAGSSFRYVDLTGAAGGVQKVTYGFGKITIKAKGPATPHLVGPVPFAEVRFDVGAAHYCARFTAFTRNAATQVAARGPTTACTVACGDGIREGAEACDDGNATSGDGCDANCTPTACGNGIVTAGEVCDDGNTTSGDGCDANCRPTGCGNGVVTGSELCDDGNAVDGDGCDNNCKPTGCGNGIVTAGELCDDGNAVNGDGCDNNCKPTGCGNGIVTAGELCDDGNAVNGDGCDNNCKPTGCGNGIVTAGEMCDDGNTVGGDGCRANCTRELCGDGIRDPAEQCDDGNTQNADCCSSTCQFEIGPCDDGNQCTVNDVCTAGACVGVMAAAWVNEFDYDDFFGLLDDRDEFIEIAAPAGRDLGGYKIMAIEGNRNGNAAADGAPCYTDLTGGVRTGNAYFTAVIPPGTVVGDDTGTGIGFYVVCFASTSANHVAAGECDVVLPGSVTDSNLKNGYLINTNAVDCPDGILVLDPFDNLIDALSYEGQVPNMGLFGSYFQSPSYSVGVDQGWVAGVSIEKRTSTLRRAQSAAEWRLSGGCTVAAPAENPRQSTLTASITAAATTIAIANANPSPPFYPPFPASGTVQIEQEQATYAGLSGNTLTGVTRGANATAPAPHASGMVVSVVTGCTPRSNSPRHANAGQILACVPPCGDGTIDTGAGEQCDPQAVPTGCAPGTGCAAAGQPGECTCQVLCGNGTVEAGAGEECDPPGATGSCAVGQPCNADCTCPPPPTCASLVNYSVPQSGLDLCTALVGPCAPPAPVTLTPAASQTTFQLCFRAADAAGRVGITLPATSWFSDAQFNAPPEVPLALTQRFCVDVTATGTLFTRADATSFPAKRCLVGDPAKLLRSCTVSANCDGPTPTTGNGICGSRDVNYTGLTSASGTVFGIGDGTADPAGALLLAQNTLVQVFLGGDFRCTGTGSDANCVACDAVTPVAAGRTGVIKSKAVAPSLVLPLYTLWSTGAVGNTVAQAGNYLDGRVVSGAGAIGDAFASGVYQVAASNGSLRVSTPLGLPIDIQFVIKNLWTPVP